MKERNIIIAYIDVYPIVLNQYIYYIYFFVTANNDSLK